jgi:alkanesulfonate monooxygenase SsuD/methylene tetrahydromethanopterin reductase-like flavin-dependent oxidoreductase (luciferase family)
MEIALFSSLALNDISQTPAEVMDGTRQAVRMADEMGFDTAWFVEHHFSAFSICGSPLMMAMHCAAITRNIKLGPAVLVLPLHEPLRMIQEIGMLDVASGGRAVVGIGTGHQLGCDGDGVAPGPRDLPGRASAHPRDAVLLAAGGRAAAGAVRGDA